MVTLVRLVGGLIQEDSVMSEDESLIAVVAHGLISSLTAIHGLVATARSQVAANAAHADEVDRLLYLAELTAVRVTDELHRLARGLPVLEVLAADRRAMEVLIELDRRHL
jgi:hypothetical protein